MTDILKPSLPNRLITQTSTVLDGAVTALVDDTVHLVDDPSAISGGQTSPEALMPVRVVVEDKPRAR